MKKVLFLTLIFSAIISTSIHAQAGDPAQPASDAAARLQKIKETVKPQMTEKTGLTDAQADKVIEINFELRETMRGYGDLNEADRAKKVAELKVARDKKYSEIPLTAEQMAAVKSFYENMPKNPPQKSGN